MGFDDGIWIWNLCWNFGDVILVSDSKFATDNFGVQLITTSDNLLASICECLDLEHFVLRNEHPQSEKYVLYVSLKYYFTGESRLETEEFGAEDFKNK